MAKEIILVLALVFLSVAADNFILEDPVKIVSTEAGSIHVLPDPKEERAGILTENNVGLIILTMEPKSLLLPQYIDASCVLYVHKGQLTLGYVDGDELLQQDLQVGDIYGIEGGSVFYILNTDEGQRLTVYGICDTSESLQKGHFQSFFVGGGRHPSTILSGFEPEVLAAVFKVSRKDLDVLRKQDRGPIIYTTSGFRDGGSVNAEAHKPFNLLDKKADFENDNGRSISVNGKEFSPLESSQIGVFAVTLQPGAILAPHWNPRAAEVAFVTKGKGHVQIAYPNGTSALNVRVDEGTVFFVPRYFPVCQISSRDGPFEFVGFSTSARKSSPGSTSVLKALEMDILSTSFDATKRQVRDLVERQDDAVILPGLVEDSFKLRLKS